jgi:hypothetical protein
MGDLPRWKGCEKNGLIMMGDLPIWKMMVSLWRVTFPDGRWWSHYDGWPPRWKECGVWSHCYGWPTQMKDVMWQVWKMGLTWWSPEGMTGKGPKNLVLLNNSRSQCLKTQCFLIAGLTW